jgi:hypothetical protein
MANVVSNSFSSFFKVRKAPLVWSTPIGKRVRKRGEEFFWDYPLRFPVEFPGIHSGDHVIVWLATLTTLLGRGED